VTQLLNRMKQEKVDGIILDLRRNGGGYLDQAISLTGLFGRGPVVQTREPDESPGSPGKIEVESTPKGTALYDGPLILLISRYSASASEIVAGALQDYGRALIVGDKSTFSNYLAMGRIPFSYDPGSLKVTIKKFYRAGGSSTQSNGVAADIVIPSKLNYADVGESSLPNPMPWDDVSSADGLPNFNLVKPYLPELKKRSLARVETDKDFIYLKNEIDDYRKSLADLSVSLDETERLGEQITNSAHADVIKKERASRPKSAEKVYEITVENVGDPVLHPPENKHKPAPSMDDDPDSLDNVPDMADLASSDPALAEAKRIMADYISLLKRPLTAAATAK
jgi:carboxyl-terminal processing protease